MNNYDVAISFTDEEKWLALDIYNLLERKGISCYCSANDTDRIYGNMRQELIQIYDKSLINIIIYSKAYSIKDRGSIVFMEQEILFNRHVGKSDSKALYVLVVDIEITQTKFDLCLNHYLKKEGITGVEKHLIDRLINLKKAKDIDGFPYAHPPKTEKSRGAMLECAFRISSKYEKDKRWRELGDILVVVESASATQAAHKGIRTYLIPSGNVLSLLNHATTIRSSSSMLEAKKEYGKKFIEIYKDKLIHGVRFDMQNGTIAYPIVYSNKYDLFLNRSWNDR